MVQSVTGCSIVYNVLCRKVYLARSVAVGSCKMCYCGKQVLDTNCALATVEKPFEYVFVSSVFAQEYYPALFGSAYTASVQRQH
jgi:hypothetical protein